MGIALTRDLATAAPISSDLSVEGLAAQLSSTGGPATRLLAAHAALQKDSFGFSFWLNPVNLQVNDSLLAREMPYDNSVANTNRLSWQLYVSASNLTLVVRGNDRSQGDHFGTVQCPVPIPLNSGSVMWFHVAGGYDATTGTLSLFVNGIEATSAGGAGAQSSDNSPVVIGTVKNGADVVSPGVVAFFDDVQFFDGPLSASDVAELRSRPGQGLSGVIVTTPSSMRLLAHWKLDDSSPPYADFSGNSITMTRDSATTLPGRVAGVDGHSSQLRWQSPGPSTRLTANDPLLQTDSFGFSFWINPDHLKPFDNIIAKQMPENAAVPDWQRVAWQVQLGGDNGTGSAPLEFVVRGNNRAQGEFFGNVFSTARLPLYGPAEGWIHVTGGYDATTGVMKLFVNGVEAISGNSSPGADCSDDSPLDIGSVKNGGDFVGFAALTRIDDIQIYDGVPSAYEVRCLKLNPGKAGSNSFAVKDPAVFPSGSVRVTFNSYSGMIYVVEASTNLVHFVSVGTPLAVSDSTSMIIPKATLDGAFGAAPKPKLYFRVRAVIPVNQPCE